MKKLWFLVGIAVGFVLGSRAGRGAYNDLASLTSSLMERPEVKRFASKAKGSAKDQAASAARKAGERVTSAVTSVIHKEPAANESAADESYADPQDLQFGRAAAKKEETLDKMLAQGLIPEELDEEPRSVRPRAGGKAEPVEPD